MNIQGMFRIIPVLILLCAARPVTVIAAFSLQIRDFTKRFPIVVGVFCNRKDHIETRTIILEYLGQTRYYLSMFILRYGPYGPRIIAMKSAGKPLKYKRIDRLLFYCTDGCHKTKAGVITLTPPIFNQAADTGMTIAADRVRRRYQAQVPAHILRTRLAAMGIP